MNLGFEAVVASHGFDMSIPPARYVETEAEAEQWVDRFLQTHVQNNGLGFDTETTGVNITHDRPLYWSMSDGMERICAPIDLIYVFKEDILENPEVSFDFSRAKFDAHMAANAGIDMTKAKEWRDVGVQSWLENENNMGRHGLKELVADHFGRTTPTFTETFGKGQVETKSKKDGRILRPAITTTDLLRRAFETPETKMKAADYASLDAYNATTMRKHLDQRLKMQRLYPGFTLFDYFYLMEVPYTKVLFNMERRGITADRGHLRQMQGPMEEKMSAIAREFNREASSVQSRMLNLNSTPDLRWFFYEHLKHPVEVLTDGGKSGNKQPSTEADVLDGWAGQGDPWALKLMDYRSVSKIHGTYVLGLQQWIDHNFRIHTTLNQTGTVTGRLSSKEPNLQNIPRPSEDDFKIREAFTHGEGTILIVADYEQLEMRLMAHFSQDQKMIRAIIDGMDLHCLTVSEMYGIPYDEVMAAKKAEKDYKKGIRKEPLTDRENELLFFRQAAKATGFGIIYGIGGEHLAANLTKELKRLVTKEEGFELIRKWFGVFPGVKDYIEDRKTYLWNHGFVQVITGRFRRFGDLRGMGKGDAKRAERQAVNAIIQGTAAEIAKAAMIRADSDPELKGYKAELLLQVHDELIFECPDNEDTIKGVKKRVKEIMEHALSTDFLVPLPVEIGHGHTWASAK